MSLFGSEMTLEAAMELFPSLKVELVRVIYENEENGAVAFQFVGDGGYMTKKQNPLLIFTRFTKE